MRLRYIGAEPLTFVTLGEARPGDEFTVPDDQADAFLRRGDFKEAPPEEPAPDPAPAPAKARKTAKTTENDAASAAPEE